jgi:hypothetical protein
VAAAAGHELQARMAGELANIDPRWRWLGAWLLFDRSLSQVAREAGLSDPAARRRARQLLGCLRERLRGFVG